MRRTEHNLISQPLPLSVLFKKKKLIANSPTPVQELASSFAKFQLTPALNFAIELIERAPRWKLLQK
jgi:hypothetical protein